MTQRLSGLRVAVCLIVLAAAGSGTGCGTTADVPRSPGTGGGAADGGPTFACDPILGHGGHAGDISDGAVHSDTCIAGQYCSRTEDSNGTGSSSASCQPLPVTCSSPPSCDSCFPQYINCQCTGSGFGLVWTCQAI